MRKLIVIILSLIGIFGIYISWQGIVFLSTSAQPNHSEMSRETVETVIFDVPEGTSFYTAAKELFEKGLITDVFKFKILVKLLYPQVPLKVGEYQLSATMRPREIIEILTSGQSITYPMTVPEGQNIFEIRDQLNQRWPGRGDEFFSLVTDAEFTQKLMGFNVDSLEGYLYPETYTLSKYTAMRVLINNMVEQFKSNYSRIVASSKIESSKIKMSLQEQVTLASVIEKETGAPEERQLISSVFHNRLKKRMRLQSDPTILYGILVETQQMKNNITKADIHKPTAYNTYTVPALPKGPIANPGYEALWAAANPAESDYLYFVSRNDGTHIFTTNYKDHEKAVKKFQLDSKMRKNKSWRDRARRN